MSDNLAQLRAGNLRLRQALEFCRSEAATANEVIRLKRDQSGQGRIRVATALHRIENWNKYLPSVGQA